MGIGLAIYDTRIININVFWYVTQRNLVDGYRSLEDISANLFGTKKKSILKKGAVCSNSNSDALFCSNSTQICFVS